MPQTTPSGWRKSSHSSDNGGNCIEVATTNTAVPIRDSENRSLGHLTVTQASWSALVAAFQAP
ncbi:DUF397 domain-containing protein [Embleya sp. MST-111070]|uniref:DUF397 domain-containing protein n=1 Tax=Embleya sp. MST-111070 TaxID=3398231 RepID=UPI003F740B72